MKRLGEFGLQLLLWPLLAIIDLVQGDQDDSITVIYTFWVALAFAWIAIAILLAKASLYLLALLVLIVYLACGGLLHWILLRMYKTPLFESRVS